MSLFDAILLDEYRDPKDVWITQRNDGMAGSGTASDPADAGVKQGAALSISTLSYNIRQVLCVTPLPHGLSNGATISIYVTRGPGRGPYYSLNNSPSTYQFPITWVSDYSFTIALLSDPQGAPSSMDFVEYQVGPRNPLVGGTAVRLFWPVANAAVSNHGYANYEAISVQGVTPTAFNGNVVALGVDNAKNTGFYYRLLALPGAASGTGGTVRKQIFRFDLIMNALPSFALARLGSAPSTNPIMTRGTSNIYLANPTTLSPVYPGFELRPGQKIRGSGVDATTVQIQYATDTYNPTAIFGRIDTSEGNALNYIEISDLTADSNMAGQLVPPTNATYQAPMGPVITVPDLAPVCLSATGIMQGGNGRLRRIRAINWGTQSYPESFILTLYGTDLPKANNCIEDCTFERPSENNTHEITIAWALGGGSPIQGGISAYGSAGVVRRNYVNCFYANGVSNRYIPIQSISLQPATSGTTAGSFTVTLKLAPGTVLPRGLGNNLKISGVLYTSGGTSLAHPFYNNSFPILSRSGAEFVCYMLDRPTTGWPTNVDISKAFVGVDFHGPIAYNGTGGVVEGNAIYDCTNPGYTDTSSTRDVAIRDNYISDTFYGFYQNFNPGRSVARLIATSNGVTQPVPADPQLIEILTVDDHYFVKGDLVKLELIRAHGGPDPTYNKVFSVESVNPTDPKKFRVRLYQIPSFPPDNPQPGGADTPNYFAYWQTKRALIENNLIDLYKVDQYSYSTPQACISVIAQNTLTEFPGWLFRENIIRHFDSIPTNKAGVSELSVGLRMSGLGSPVIDSNLINVDNPFPFQYLEPREEIQSNNNTTIEGKDLRGAGYPASSNTPDQMLDDWLSRIEDCLVL